MARELPIPPLNRASVGDGYTNAATYNCPGARRLTIFVYNNSVLYELAYDRAGNQWVPNESELPPGFHSLARDCSGIRFRNLVAGSVGIVSVKAVA